MASIHVRKRHAVNQDMFRILVVMQLFHQFTHAQYTGVESSSQAFVQTDKELRYIGNGEHLGIPPLHTIPGKKLEDSNLHNTFDNPIIFEPPLLEFEEQPIGMPHLKRVTIQNRDSKNEIHLLSISGSTLHFHCSFFDEKYVPPGSNTTFEVVYLARQVGNVENTLYIHTNIGIFKYQVFGVGVPNPYRNRPILGAKVPLNTSFTSLIQLHNPHSSTLHVQEVYSSGGDLHLQLPSGEIELSKDMWEIPPYDTKPIMKANFLGRIENNHTAFIRIRTKKEENDNVLVLPVEVEVSSETGIYSTIEMLDFGIVRSCDEPKKLKLNVINSGIWPLHIHQIDASPPNDAIHIDFWPTHLKPDLWEPSTVAIISYNASKALHAKQWSGDIVIRSKDDNHKLVIPYQATVLHGSISYKDNKTLFYSGQPNRTITRSLPITNHFDFTLAIHNVSFPPDVQGYFSFDKFQKPVYIKSGETISPFNLRFNLNQSNIHFKTELCLHTNISAFYIPIYVYNGKLTQVYHRPETYRGQIDFGTLNMLQEYSMLFTLRNNNPVDIVIRDYGANLEKTTIQLLGIENGNGTMLTMTHNGSLEDVRPLLFKSNHFAVFNITLVTTDSEATFAGELIFYTQYENLYIPISMRTAEGGLQLKPNQAVLDKCFPGKICQLDLRLVSTFEIYMALRKVFFHPNDTRFYFKAPTEEDVVLDPESDKNIGRLYFDPVLGATGCGHECYVGLPPFIPAGHQWLLGSRLGIDTSDIDQFLYRRLRQKWADLKQQQTNVVNVSMQLDTNQMRGFLFDAQAHLHWPTVRGDSLCVHFPLTQIGNTTIKRLVVENPSDINVIMQFVPLPLYPNPQIILDLMRDKIPQSQINKILEDVGSDVFLLYDLEKYNPTRPNISSLYHRQWIEQTTGVPPHPESIAIVVGQRTRVRLRIGFKPIDHLPKTSLLVIRNNLTIIDVVVLHGHGGQGDIKFGNRKVGSAQPLLFEITEKILNNCDKKRTGKTNPNFTVRKSFTAKNSGQLPFYVQGFSINGSPCEGYGFKILECVGFELQPNASKKVDIAFTPDFTMSRIQRSLTLHTSLGPAINYTLQAIIPAHLLTKCSAALPRPLWEPLLYYSIVCVMGFFLFCILVAAYFEADRIFTTDLIQAHKYRQTLSSNGTSSPTSGHVDLSNVFNLKAIAGVTGHTGANGNVRMSNGINTKTAAGLCNQNNTAPIYTPSPPNISRPYSAGRRKKEPSFLIFNLLKKALSYIKFPKLSFKLFASGSSHTHNTFNSNKPGSSSKDSENHQKDLKYSNTDGKNDGNCNHSVSKTTVKREISISSGDHEHEEIQKSNNKQHKMANHQLLQNDPDLIADLIERERINNKNEQYDAPNQKSKHDHDNSTFNNSGKSQNNLQDTTGKIDYDESFITTTRKNRKNRTNNSNNHKIENTVEPMQPVADHADDSSSTATDCSTEAVEDKNPNARDSTPELQLNMQKVGVKKNKKKNNNNIQKDTNSSETTPDGLDFTFSKSKNKKIPKMSESSNSFDGQSITSCEYDLPYMMKGDHRRPIGSEKQRGRNNRNNKSYRKPNSSNNKSVHVDGNEESSIYWDPPKFISPDGDLSDLSTQTQLFEKQHKGSSSNLKVGASGGDSGGHPAATSYSSVVSSTNEGKKATLRNFVDDYKPIGSNIPISSSKSIYNNNMQGNSLNAGITTIGNSGTMPWSNQPVSLPSPVVGSGSGFNFVPSSESDTALNMMSHNNLNNVGSNPGMASIGSKFGLQDLQKIGQTSNSEILRQPLQPGQPTMMQQLLQDRRKRQLEYQQKVLTHKEEWPFFNLPTPQENSFWDSSNSPVDNNWSNSLPSEAAAYPSTTSSLWGDSAVIGGGLNANNWAPIGSLWNRSGMAVEPTSVQQTPITTSGIGSPNGSIDGSSNTSLHGTPPPPINSLIHQISPSSSPPVNGGFSPFNTLEYIWNSITPQQQSDQAFNPAPKPDEDQY